MTLELRSLVVALSFAVALFAGSPMARATTPVSSADLSTDVTVELDAATFDDEDVAVDDFASATPAGLGGLPSASDIDAYYMAPNGDQLISFDTTVLLPGGVTAAPEDVIRFDGVAFSVELDGSAVGVPPGANVDAVATGWMSDYLLSFDTTVDLGGVVYDDEDVVSYDGVDFVAYFDGSTAGVAPGLDLDAVHVLAENHNLVVSFDGSGQLGGVTFDDEDALEFDGVTWSLAYDGSAEHATLASADLDALNLVPEPGGLLLLCAGLPLLGALARRRRARAHPLPLLACLLLFATLPRVVQAVDGVIEINQVRAVAGGVTPGDAPDFPVTLSESGSYILTSNLDVRGLSGEEDLVAVEIAAPDVTLDLNGFRIVGPTLCSGTPGSLSCSPGLGVGISGTAANSSVLGGSVSGFAAGGVVVGHEARLRDLRAADNGLVGLAVGSLSSIHHSVALGNGGPGISTGNDSVVFSSNASFNDGYGFELGAGSGFSNSVISANGSGPVIGGVELDANVCDGVGACTVVCTDGDSDGYDANCAPFDCNDGDPLIKPGAIEICDLVDNNCDGSTDEGCSTASEAIGQARASSGVVSIVIGNGIVNPLVTYVLPAVGGGPVGFFLQAEAVGPALFVAVDPATLSPSPAVGDEISITIDEMTTVNGLPQAIAVSNINVYASGQLVTPLTQDVSGAGDLVSALDSYDSELISVTGNLTGPFAFAGTGFVIAPLDTAGVMGGALGLRIPASLQSILGSGTGCSIQLSDTPLLRFNASAQPQAWNASELAGTTCPDVTVNDAHPTNATTVVVVFERDIEPASVLGDGSQFSFTGGLTASAAAVSGSEVTVTTNSQASGAAYIVTVALSVQDTLGGPVSGAADSAVFKGWKKPAVVYINEVNANVASNCDLVELRVAAGGTLDGFELFERDVSLLIFSGLDVAANDYVIVHFNNGNSNCNPAFSSSETVSKTEYPASTHVLNYDTAWDWFTTDTGMDDTTNVLTLVDPLGNIVDAVFLADDFNGTTTPQTATQAAVVAAAGEWEQVGGGIPPGGFVDADFRAHAVLDLDATDTTVGGTSIQRDDDGDTNTEDDWTDAENSTWAANNAGQSDFLLSASEGIALARASSGSVSIGIANALVTYERTAIGSDGAGFFLQAETAGPALLVAVDPATLSPSPAVGDEISITIDEMTTVDALPQATAVSGVAIHASGQPLAGLVQDVSTTVNLVSALDSYDSELISLTGTLTGNFQSAGSGFGAAPLDTAIVIGEALELRLPSTLLSLIGTGSGCAIQLTQTPLLRFNSTAQAQAYLASELAGTTCPAPTIDQASAALDATTLWVDFDRDIDPASVLSNGSQFTFTGGLTASAASVSGSRVTVTTSTQTPSTGYTLTVATNVQDLLGGSVSGGANTAAFIGWAQPASVRINEVNANITSGCDLVELRVVSGGTMNGFQLLERTASILTFAGLDVATNDYVVVHLDENDSACNPAGSGDETSSKSEYPSSTHTLNYDGAYDWYSTDFGLTQTDNVLTLLDPLGGIVDAVLLSDDPTGTAASASETQAAAVAAAGEWEQVGGGIPAGGFVDDDFNAHAVQDLDATGIAASGTSIQRNDDDDNNDRNDWTDVNNSSFSANNPGQSDL